MVQTGARVPKMAKCCFWVTTPPGSQTFLQRQNTCGGIVIWVFYDEKWDNDSIIAAFEQNDRICVGTGLTGRHREQPMAGNFISVYWCEGFSHTPGFCTAYRACPAGSRQGKGDRTIISRHGGSFFKEAHPSAIEHFVAARQLAGHPVSVSRW